jgi:transcriptional regulator GlxA family with amidase domain
MGLAMSTLTGLYDVLNAFTLPGLAEDKAGRPAPFHVEIVGETAGLLEFATRVPIKVQRSIAEIDDTATVIVPSVLLRPEGSQQGRFPGLVDWIIKMHRQGAVLCPACSDEDPAFFRRLFKRTTGLAPGDYRRRYRVPDFSPARK